MLDFRLVPQTDNYAVMGDPIAHSKSPDIHQAFASQTGQSICYQAIHVPDGLFENAIQQFRELGGCGLNITVPYKQIACRLSDTLSSRARSAGAVNTLSISGDGSLHGDNTDGVGLVRDLKNYDIAIQGRRVLIIGAGGAVRGILGPLIDLKPASVLVANRTPARAEQLVSGFKTRNVLTACGLDSLGDEGSFDVIINGTSLGLTGELPALPDSIVSSTSCCYDMVYGDTETVFNRWCRENGAKLTVDGLGMLVEQAAESFLIWRGVRPETQPVIAVLRKDMR